MVSLRLIRSLFIILCGLVAYTFSVGGIIPAQSNNPIIYVAIGLIIGVAVVLFEIMARRVSIKGLSSGVFGIVFGLLLGRLFILLLVLFELPPGIHRALSSFIYLVCIYIGLTLGLKGKEEFNLIIPYVRFRRQEFKEENVIVDTSSIIDGRILDIVKTGFVEAKFIVSRYVLNELQALADSTDYLKRQKGKRGIEILHSLKKEPMIEIVIYERELDSSLEVDEKLVKLAKSLDSKIITTDYNLNRIAQLQGIRILNINDLANALKPILLPGEHLSLKLIKEGKEHNQAIAYLDDGTMVVVENGRRLIGNTVAVEVTSILQSPSGRIIFTKLVE
ncbi:MAG: PIN domain-containing protein [Candidatus Omnitrophota bacterium]